MVIEIWVLVAAGVAVAGLVAFLCLLVRRALTELFFWRGAFKCASDRAFELLAEASAQKSEATLRRERQQAASRRVGSAGCNGHADIGGFGPRNPDSLLQRYSNSVDVVMQEAQRRKIDWVSEADREYYWSHHAQDRQSPDLSVS